MEGEEFEMMVDPSQWALPIAGIVNLMGPKTIVAPNINDHVFPVNTYSPGIIRYKIVPGEDLVEDDGWVYPEQIELDLNKKGEFFPRSAVQALWPLPMDDGLGFDNTLRICMSHPELARKVVFTVEPSSISVARRIGLKTNLTNRYPASDDFLVICRR